MSYLMESSAEGERLRAQAAASPSRERLLAAGLTRGAHVLDAGCGSGGTVTEMLELVGPEARILGIDASGARIQQARAAVVDPRASFEVAALPATGLAAQQFDFTYCQFVFEYLADTRAALDELIRVTRPGGRVAVVDCDRIGLDFWPRPPALDQGQAVFRRALEAMHFDLEAGRKLFALFRAAGLKDIAVHASMLYLTAGPADGRLMDDWITRFEVLEPAVAPFFGSAGGYREFCEAYLQMLKDPDTLKYILVLTTSGTKA